MVGFIKKLFSGIIAFFSGFLGEKKSEQITKDAASLAEKTVSSAEELVSSATAKTRKVRGYFLELVEGEETKPEVKSASSNGVKTPQPVTAAKPAKVAKADVASQAETNGQGGGQGGIQGGKVDLVQTAEGVKAQPAKANAKKVEQIKTETTFAPKYLAPSGSSNARRRPGPNMSPFLDMARQVKTQG